jgi:hypothetical protein
MRLLDLPAGEESVKIGAHLNYRQLRALGDLAGRSLHGEGLLLHTVERRGPHKGAITVQFQRKGPTYSIVVLRIDRDGELTTVGERPLMVGQFQHREDAGVLA